MTIFQCVDFALIKSGSGKKIKDNQNGTARRDEDDTATF